MSNLKLNLTATKTVELSSIKSLENLAVNRFDIQLAKLNTLGEQYTINSQRLTEIHEMLKAIVETIKFQGAKLSSLEKLIGETKSGKNDSVLTHVLPATTQSATQKKIKSLTINNDDHKGLRKEIAENLEFGDSFETFYNEIFKVWNRVSKLYTNKKNLSESARVLWNEFNKNLADQDLEAPYCFPSASDIEPHEITPPAPSQTQIWAQTMGIQEDGMIEAVKAVREVTESQITEFNVLSQIAEQLKIKSDHASFKAWAKWLMSNCKKG